MLPHFVKNDKGSGILYPCEVLSPFDSSSYENSHHAGVTLILRLHLPILGHEVYMVSEKTGENLGGDDVYLRGICEGVEVQRAVSSNLFLIGMLVMRETDKAIKEADTKRLAFQFARVWVVCILLVATNSGIENGIGHKRLIAIDGIVHSWSEEGYVCTVDAHAIAEVATKWYVLGPKTLEVDEKLTVGPDKPTGLDIFLCTLVVAFQLVVTRAHLQLLLG